MSSFRASLIAGLADLAPDQILDVMGYIKSRPRYLGRLQRWVCLRAYDHACSRIAVAAEGLTAEQCREAAVGMLRRRECLRWGVPLTQTIESGYERVGHVRWPYGWNGARLTFAGHQFNVRELLASKPASAPVARLAMPVQLDLFGVVA